jgi:hypothetical protein
LTRHEALPKDRIIAVETGGCPHAAIREDMYVSPYLCSVFLDVHTLQAVYETSCFLINTMPDVVV